MSNIYFSHYSSNGSQNNSKLADNRNTLPPAKHNGNLVTSGGTHGAGNKVPKGTREVTKHQPLPPQVRRDDVKHEGKTLIL